MNTSIRMIALALLLCVLSIGLTAGAQAQNRKGRGTVSLRDQTVSKKKSSGTGTVIPVGGYYTAPTVYCTANLSVPDLADGTQVYVTVEYASTANLPPVYIGSISVTGGKGVLSTVAKPVAVSSTVGIYSMTVHRMDGSVLLTGTVRGLN
jgi:hypothetical protein